MKESSLVKHDMKPRGEVYSIKPLQFNITSQKRAKSLVKALGCDISKFTLLPGKYEWLCLSNTALACERTDVTLEKGKVSG